MLTRRIVFIEGNYVLLDQEPWSQLQSEGMLNDRIFVDTHIDECMNRVFRCGWLPCDFFLVEKR